MNGSEPTGVGSGWRPALRIARRSMRRNLGRSFVIAALIGVPIAGATVVDVLLQTTTDREHAAYRAMGNADGQAEVTEFASLPNWRPRGEPDGGPANGTGGNRDPFSVDLASLLPPGSRVVPDGDAAPLRLTQDGRVVHTSLEPVATGDALTEHEARLVSGRLPRNPNEALLTEPLAERLGLLDGEKVRADATITADGTQPVTVTGLVVTPQSIDAETVVAPPDSELRNAAGVDDPAEVSQRYLVDLPPGADPDAVWPALAREGVAFTPRAAYTDPAGYPRAFDSVDPLATVGPIAVVMGFGVLEVVLLAGAAFAVGARRQVRELGLIVANGGTEKHVRRVVLAQGFVLGLVGAVGGLLFGGLAIVAGWPVWERLTGEVIDGWRFGWLELAIATAIGLLSGLVAALRPAFGAARMKPVDALARRFRTTPLAARLRPAGVVMLALGIVGLLIAGVLARQVTYYPAADVDLPSDPSGSGLIVLIAGPLALVGLVLSTSGLLAALARVGARLPLSARLALRDANRHRHRTVPAIAAIMVVVAASVALAFLTPSNARGDAFFASQPDNTLLVRPDLSLSWPDATAAQVAKGRRELDEGIGDVAAKLPGSSTVDVPTLADGHGATLCPAYATCAPGDGGIGVATPESLELALGRRPDAGLRATLDEGKLVAVDRDLMEGSGLSVEPLEGSVERTVLSARYAAPPAGTLYDDLPAAFMSAKAAAEHGWTANVDMIAVRYPATASQGDIDAAVAVAEDHGFDVYSPPVDVVEMYNESFSGVAALVTLLGVGITIALSAAEGRADLATLAAIGARPRRRRLLAGAQAFVIGGVGTVLGVVLGGIGAFALSSLGGGDFAVPWFNLAFTLVAVPLLAVGVAMAVTRSKLPMVRRLE